MKRSAEKSWYPSCWDVPGGHIETGETSVEALIREASEELAVVVAGDDAMLLDVLHSDDFELTVYMARRWVGAATNAAPEEHDELEWPTVNEIADRPLAHPLIADLAGTAVRMRA